MKTRFLVVVLILSGFLVSPDKTYGCNDPPNADLDASPNPVCVGRSVTLDGSGSSDPDGEITKYEWDWTNDGEYDYEETPGDGIATHIYTIAGTYTAKLRVTDDDDATETDTCTVYVVKVNYVTEDKTLACVNETITFTAHAYPSRKPLGCIEWEKRYRANSGASWGTWGGASGGDNTAVLNTSTAGCYQYRAWNGSDDTWKESSEVTVVKVENVTFDPKVLRADGSFTSTASATITPDTRTITWSIEGNALGCSINSSTGIITAGTSVGTITIRAADSELSDCYAQAEIKVVKLQNLTVSGADYFGGTSPKIYTTAQQAGANVTITAVLNPSVPVADLPPDFVTWTNGTAGANQLERIVSRGTAGTDVTVTATCAVSKSVRIYVRRVDASNPTVTPTENVTTGSAGNNCTPSHPVLDDWHVTSVGNLWYARVDEMTCAGTLNVSPWPNLPNTMTVPNTANPVDGGNINNTPGSSNRWSYAQSDLGDYATVSGRGPDWHRTSASSAHEWYHWNTDWMVSCIGTAGNWSGTETDIENLNVSVFTYLTEADAKTALTASVNTRFTTFDNAAVNHWNNVIIPADVPGGGGGAYAAGQAVLNGDISAIETYRISKGW